ncbi:MAG TPA: HNH endonuclease signature motif containing protein [Phycisphaerae bacterium]|nr:HNH endonuclease signature motif containing protein [Phycisphaerae bacterium]
MLVTRDMASGDLVEPIRRIEMKYFETYYICNVVSNVLNDPMPYIRRLHDFFGDGRTAGLVAPFRKFSALHEFLWFVADDLMWDAADEFDLAKRQQDLARFPSSHLPEFDKSKWLPVEAALAHYAIQYPSFEQWLLERGSTFGDADENDVSDYMDDFGLDQAHEDLLTKMVEEAFFLLFMNRAVLVSFNELAATHVQEIDPQEEEEPTAQWFARSGVLKRVSPPSWAKRAVYFRDRGHCVLCRKDLTDLLSLDATKNFDHVVPLARGGLNDVSNLQLICGSCNLQKSDGESVTSDLYEHWF